ncbi:MAG: hypothetical protein AAGD43_09495 [Pseudomonadota bacterium]
MKPYLFLLAGLAATPAVAEDIAFDITFRTHVFDGLAEQDVYVRTPEYPNGVLRPSAEFTDYDAALFASASPQAHAPGNPHAVGPFPAGRELNVTLGDWLAATGSGEYHCENGQGHLTVEFQDLVPNGVYTIWHFFMVNGATEPFIGTFDLPIGALDGSQSGFTADDAGSATFDQTFGDCLQLTGSQLMAGLALNWHSDGQTYGVLPGMFGHNAHIQLYTDLPAEPQS